MNPSTSALLCPRSSLITPRPLASEDEAPHRVGDCGRMDAVSLHERRIGDQVPRARAELELGQSLTTGIRTAIQKKSERITPKGEHVRKGVFHR